MLNIKIEEAKKKMKEQALKEMQEILTKRQQDKNQKNTTDLARLAKAASDYSSYMSRPLNSQPDPNWGYYQYGGSTGGNNTNIGQSALGNIGAGTWTSNFPMITEANEAALKALTSKSPFEIILDTLFTDVEKVQFLQDLGYRFEKISGSRPILNEVLIKRITPEGEYTWDYSSMDSLFLKEITIKFKNLLLAKPSLKIKI